MLYRRNRRVPGVEDEADVPLSPLIDCVFLLLIFFLVTTMLKRKETMIPITMPDSSSALSAEARDDTLIIGLSGDGAFLEPAGRDRFGALSYQGGTTLDQYLDRLARDIGPEVLLRPIRFDIARETPFQRTIDALDICKLRGFMNVSVKIRQPFEE